MIYTGYIALQDWNTMAEVLYQRWSFLYVGVYQWPLVQTFSSLICFRWKFPSLLQRGLRQRMICYCWYVTNFGDQLGLTTNAALQKEWSHQLALWISYQGTGIPHICHEHHERRSCKFFLAGVNFYRFNAKNWHFRQILREKVAFFLQI